MAIEIEVALREEIVECQKAKAEFIRWKLIIVAAIGVVALGLDLESGTLDGSGGLPILFALIPLVCLYVDSACLHNDSRILVIGAFLRTGAHVSEESKEYELYCQSNRRRYYGEGFVLFVTSFVLSLFVLVWGLHAGWTGSRVVAWPCGVSGALGLLASGILGRNFLTIQTGGEPWQILPFGGR